MAPYRRRMVNAARVRDDIVRLAHRGLPVPEFAQAVGGAILRAVPAERRHTLVATRADDGYRFDVRLQGEGETVFFDV